MERYVTTGNWGVVESLLPAEVDEKQKGWLKSYFNAQIAVADKKFERAYRIFHKLDNTEGFNDFEVENESLFAAIDIAVRKTTNRDVEPSFKLIRS
ncbi:hypothetical protein ACFL1Q_00175 [Patescibacteria group bacterium]